MERKRVISCSGEDLSGSSPLGNKTSILQQPYHEKNRPASPKHPFLFENWKKSSAWVWKKKHSHRGSSLRDSPKWTEITTYPGYHVHISCDDLRSTNLGSTTWENCSHAMPCSGSHGTMLAPRDLTWIHGLIRDKFVATVAILPWPW